tara:strand:+ start:2777 stop:3505 length:729 start_codon:yes stop_codon:yes gene_type:complete
MLSKNQAKIIQSLRLKKFRQKYNLFVAEGMKTLQTIILSDQYKIKTLYFTKPLDFNIKNEHEITQVSIDERTMKSISFLNNPSNVLALVETLTPEQIDWQKGIYLDGVQDPGNVGTIIRIADWYGYDAVIRSPDSADFYNPKVIQSTMGAFANVHLIEMKREELLVTDMQLLAADMYGISTDQVKPARSYTLIMGSEGQGLSKTFADNADLLKISIVGNKDRVSESLNVSVATGIICESLKE